MQVTVGAITVTAQATSSPDRHDTQGSGDFYLATNGDIHLAISGDLQLATNGDFHVATDTVALFQQACLPMILDGYHPAGLWLQAVRNLRGFQCRNQSITCLLEPFLIGLPAVHIIKCPEMQG